ncbi:MAG: glycosyltransferase family 4 protein [bacterium]|nr:glycosyltransferase family 4 protein [bacterium]
MSLKILLIHNRYLEKGGEDEVVNAEAKLLTEHGHKVILYEKSNEDIRRWSFFKKALFFLRELRFSKTVYKEVKEIVKRENPDIAHITNIFFCVTPSAYIALNEENVPIVQSLHNYRFFCIRGTFFDKGVICERCKDKEFFNAIIRKCWRNSFFLSFFLAKLLYKSGFFLKNVDSFIVTSKFSREKFIEFGLEEKRMHLKVNFLTIEPKENSRDYNYALFLGRLVDYKGVETLMKAFKICSSFNLKIVGDGPLRRGVQSFASSHNNIEWLGRIERDSVLEAIENSSFVIFPSECFENMPIAIIESFAFSKPVLASNLGAIKEFVIDGVSGILFEPGNEKDLAAKISYLFSHGSERMEMGKNANKIYRERFNKEKNYRDLLGIYNKTMTSKKRMN